MKTASETLVCGNRPSQHVKQVLCMHQNKKCSAQAASYLQVTPDFCIQCTPSTLCMGGSGNGIAILRATVHCFYRRYRSPEPLVGVAVKLNSVGMHQKAGTQQHLTKENKLRDFYLSIGVICSDSACPRLFQGLLRKRYPKCN